MIDYSIFLNYRIFGLDIYNYVLGCYVFDFREVILFFIFY